MPIEVDLNGERKPCGDANMHEPELPVKEIIVKTQTLAPGVDQAGSIFSIGKLETLTCLHCGKDTYEPSANAIFLGNFPGFFLFPNPAVQVNVRSSALFSHGLGVSFDPLRMLGDKLLEILEKKALGRHEPIHAFRPTDPQISFKQNSIKTGYRSGDFLCMLIDKFFHGVLPYVVVGELPH